MSVGLILRMSYGLLLLAWSMIMVIALRFDCLNYALLTMAISSSLMFVTRLAFIVKKSMGHEKKGLMGGMCSYLKGHLLFILSFGNCTCALITSYLSFLLPQLKPWTFYPAISNTLSFLVFFASVFTRFPIATSIASLKGNLTRSIIEYTTKVTAVWSVFFLLSAIASIVTCIQSDFNLWVLFNGCLYYLAFALLFCLERLVCLILDIR